jgi:hypothetical protein
MADTRFTNYRCKGRSSMTTDHTITYSVFEPKKPRSDRSPFLLSLLLSLPVHPPAEQPHTCRSPDLRIVAFIRLPGLPVAGLCLNECSPITVAGPLRNCTGFPLGFPYRKNMCGLFRSDLLYSTGVRNVNIYVEGFIRALYSLDRSEMRFCEWSGCKGAFLPFCTKKGWSYVYPYTPPQAARRPTLICMYRITISCMSQTTLTISEM